MAFSGIWSSISDSGTCRPDSRQGRVAIIHRLFIYGSLQPGGPNEHVLANIGGEFAAAAIRGRLVQQGWGASLGYPGLVLDEAGNEVPGHVFTSTNLPEHWPMLDGFEGAEYARVSATVTLTGGEHVDAWVYVLAT